MSSVTQVEANPNRPRVLVRSHKRFQVFTRSRVDHGRSIVGHTALGDERALPDDVL
jgi:hypothetical protein